jgi:hypothetical protein
METIISLITEQAIGAVIGLILGWFGVKKSKPIFDRFRAIEPFVEFAEKKMYELGKNTKEFSKKRLDKEEVSEIEEMLVKSRGRLIESYIRGVSEK